MRQNQVLWLLVVVASGLLLWGCDDSAGKGTENRVDVTVDSGGDVGEELLPDVFEVVDTTELPPRCTSDADCNGGVCDTSSGECVSVSATCTDGAQNGDELAVDCGGSCPEACPAGTLCTDDGDCASGFCSSTGSCACMAGTVDDGSGACVDVDECSDNSANCDVNATCTNTPGSFTCVCNAGFAGDGLSCFDAADCSVGGAVCDTNATCTDSGSGSFCVCDSGFVGAGTTCSDIDECSNATHGCSVNATCTNTDGAYTCACNTGYTGTGVTCAEAADCVSGGALCDANATCTNTGSGNYCVCNAGYGGDGATCTDTDECGLSGTCDVNATCSNSVGSYTCTCNAGYVGDGATCSGATLAGDGSVGLPWSWEDGTYSTSCQTTLNPGAPYVYSNTGDGYYAIDPTGVGTPITVYCDMTTDGGGWTCIDPATAHNGFGFDITDLGAPGVCTLNGDMPQGKTTTGLGCRYDVDLGFDFDTLRTSNVRIEAHTGGGGNTSDLSYVDAPWGSAQCAGLFMGDVLFGSAANGSGSISLGRFYGAAPCESAGSYADAAPLDWSGDLAHTYRDSVLRLEFGEFGGQDEGWRWASGCVYVRDEGIVLPVGAGTDVEPIRWDDGTAAQSCDQYLNPPAGYVYTGPSTGDGFYDIQPPSAVSPLLTRCDMTTDGGGWTCVDPALAHALGFTITDNSLGGAGGVCIVNGDSPEGVTPNDLSCRYDVDLGFSFNRLRTQDVVISAVAATPQVSDLTFVDGDWGTNYCALSGDVVFGGAAHPRAAMSLGRFDGAAACAPHRSLANGESVTWTELGESATSGTVLRLEFGEDGGETEGWRWDSGCVYVKQAIGITGLLTQVEPGHFADGSYAESCKGYRWPSSGAYAYDGTTGDGYYAIDPGLTGAPVTVQCDMSTQGGGWTCVDPTTANNQLGGFVVTSLATAGVCTLNGDMPEGKTTTGLMCRYDVDLGFTFDTLRTSNVIIEAYTGGGGNTSDLTTLDAPWGNANCQSTGINGGDVRFGSVANGTGALSLGAFNGLTPACSNVLLSSANGVQLPWDGARAATAADSVLRLEFGEWGGQDEGWRWASGCLMVR